MDVHVAAEGPVREALEAGLADADVTVIEGVASDLEDARFGVVAGVVGDGRFEQANEAAIAGATPWIAVEVGGLGGVPLEDVDAAVTGHAPGTGCHQCLETRVATTEQRGTGPPTSERSLARLAGALAASECVGLFAGREPSIVGQVVELPHVRRRLLPVPGCVCETVQDRSLGRDTDTMPLEAAVEACDAVVDDRVGIVTQVGEASSFPAPYYLATLAETDPLSDASAPGEAAGVDADWNAAFVKAVGESLERYCGAIYREDDLVTDPPGAVCGPDAFVRPGEGDVDHWVSGEHLETGETTWLPASEVHFPPPSPRVRPSITTGLGLGSSTVDALVAGLTEVIERDAAMIAWYSSYEPVGLSVEHDTFQTLERRAAGESLAVTAVGLTQDVDVPVVAVAVHRESAWPRFAVGSAAALDGERAAVGALCEALQNWMELRELGSERAHEEAGGSIAEYADRPPVVEDLVDVPPRVSAAALGPDPVPTDEAALETLLEAVSAAGLDAYAVSLTTRDVAAVGFEAVRVVVPSAQPLFTGTPYFGERAREVPRALGFEPRLERPYHPFP